ncbi:MAG: 4-(cytidine 5'-diphospho)-2-C-methyl-D-erythritol kinase [Veillonellales bacterium]
MLTVNAYGKINLALDILGKRDDGYHEVAMIMQTIDLADTLYFSEQSAGISVSSDEQELACDQTNLAYRAASLLQERFFVKQGVHIELKKRIPLAAGLAGGSADAAGTLIGLNHRWQLGMTVEQLADLGAVLGADVPFCVRGGTMLATGRGEKLSRLPLLPSCWAILAKPRIQVSTVWAYQHYRAGAVEKHPDIPAMLACLERGDLKGITAGLCNVLESVTIPVHPEIGELKRQLQELGVRGCLMSGSGPTVFGLTPDCCRAKAVAEKLKKQSDAVILVSKVGGANGTSIAAD